MKKQMNKLFNIVVICLLSGAFFHSCGLEEVYYLEKPLEKDTAITLENTDDIKWFCSFRTNNAGNSGVGSFLGTDVYYRIYNSPSKLESDKNSIINYSESTTNPVYSASYMIDSLKYKKLQKNTADSGKFISKTGSNQDVYFRIKTTKGMENQAGDNLWQFRACISVQDVYLTDSSSGDYVYPMRIGGKKSFDFFDENEDDDDNVRDVEPEIDDEDYTNTDSASDVKSDVYYVQFFSVSVGMNDELAEFFSPAVNIGSIAVQKGK